MDGLSWKTLSKWMIWGYHYFWKHPYYYVTLQETILHIPLLGKGNSSSQVPWHMFVPRRVSIDDVY